MLPPSSAALSPKKLWLDPRPSRSAMPVKPPRGSKSYGRRAKTAAAEVAPSPALRHRRDNPSPSSASRINPTDHVLRPSNPRRVPSPSAAPANPLDAISVSKTHLTPRIEATTPIILSQPFFAQLMGRKLTGCKNLPDFVASLQQHTAVSKQPHHNSELRVGQIHAEVFYVVHLSLFLRYLATQPSHVSNRAVCADIVACQLVAQKNQFGPSLVPDMTPMRLSDALDTDGLEHQGDERLFFKHLKTTGLVCFMQEHTAGQRPIPRAKRADFISFLDAYGLSEACKDVFASAYNAHASMHLLMDTAADLLNLYPASQALIASVTVGVADAGLSLGVDHMAELMAYITMLDAEFQKPWHLKEAFTRIKSEASASISMDVSFKQLIPAFLAPDSQARQNHLSKIWTAHGSVAAGMSSASLHAPHEDVFSPLKRISERVSALLDVSNLKTSPRTTLRAAASCFDPLSTYRPRHDPKQAAGQI